MLSLIVFPFFLRSGDADLSTSPLALLLALGNGKSVAVSDPADEGGVCMNSSDEDRRHSVSRVASLGN